jgi:hypothetical protein
MVTLPHGKFQVCSGGKCDRKVVRAVQGWHTVVSFNLDEFVEKGFFSKKELAEMKLTSEDELALTDDVADYFWNDDYIGDTFREALEAAARDAEKLSLKRMPREQLPLKIGDLKFDDNIPILEQLLKGEVPRP